MMVGNAVALMVKVDMASFSCMRTCCGLFNNNCQQCVLSTQDKCATLCGNDGPCTDQQSPLSDYSSMPKPYFAARGDLKSTLRSSLDVTAFRGRRVYISALFASSSTTVEGAGDGADFIRLLVQQTSSASSTATLVVFKGPSKKDGPFQQTQPETKAPLNLTKEPQRAGGFFNVGSTAATLTLSLSFKMNKDDEHFAVSDIRVDHCIVPGTGEGKQASQPNC